ncbi:MAG: ABC transporter ATP-binding protein [Legionellales bacterium]|jgi:ABC-2 type transport system ATP-binding protein
MKALCLEHLIKTYKNGTTALKDISFSIEQGDFFALLGPNGAGKTTTIGIICSLVNKTGGTVKVFDVDIDKNWPLAKSYIGVVPQEFNFNMFETVENIILYQAGFYGIPRSKAKESTQRALKQVELWDKRNHIARTLSGGMKRRLMIARAIVHQPKLLILDEPTAGVDVEIRRSMWNFLRELNQQGTTIVLTTHYLEEVENLCHNVAIIHRGEIIENTTVKNLIARAPKESFVLDLAQPLQQAPQIQGFTLKLIDDTTLEVEIPRNTSLNELFAQLSKDNIHLTSMRNKSNRLEELFLNLVKE